MVILLLITLAQLSTSLAIADDIRDGVEALGRKDFQRALQLIRPRAEAGHPFAQWMLGDMYKNGEGGLPKDAKMAASWWAQAAAKGLAEAQLNLGDSYAAGEGVSENWKEAVKWWRKAAEQNIPRAQTGLGLALYSGHGVAEDKAEAAKWFLKAAEAGDVQSQAMIAHMYALGEGSLKQSFVDAYKWVLLAGDDAKQVPGFAMTKGMVEAALRTTERHEAVRLAQQWKFEKGKVKNPPPPPVRDEDVPTTYFVTAPQLSTKCSSTAPSELAWCDAYIAGVLDTLGGRRNLDEDAKDARLCFQGKRVSNRDVREATNKSLRLTLEDKNSPIAKSPAVGSVIAGVLVYLCK
nr:sel1 repeat family protein [Bradyrhizobium manausense]